MYRRDSIHGKAVNSNNDLEWNEYRSMRNYINNIVKRAKEQYYENIVDENSQNPKTLWKNINNIVRENKYFAQTHCIIASRFNDFFSTIGENVSNRFSGVANLKWTNPPPINTFSFTRIQWDCVFNDMIALGTDSNNDVLQMDAKLLKLSAHLIAPSLTDIYNLSLSTRVIPNEWKLARTTPNLQREGWYFSWV